MNVHTHGLPTDEDPHGPGSGKQTMLCEGEQRDERYSDIEYGLKDGREKEGLSRKTTQITERFRKEGGGGAAKR